ncbi:MAG: InlB B-repeat-containing protein [Ruthenibacterium sp.]
MAKSYTPYATDMTANNAPAPLEASASAASWGAFRAFSFALTDDWSPTGLSATASQWVQIKLDKAIQIWAVKMAMRTTVTAQDAGQVPYKFKIHGSNDGIAFTQVYATDSASPDWFAQYDTAASKYVWNAPQYVEFTSTTAAYQYFRFEFFNAQSIAKGAVTATDADTLKPTCIQLFEDSGGVPSFLVTFKDWNGAVLKTESVLQNADATPPTNPTREGYTFTGWDKTYTHITADTIVTAQYTALPVFTVTFRDWNGATLKTQTVPQNADATPPTNPTREGYTFTGWDKAYTHITADTIVTAQYAAIPQYTVMFKDWNGTVLKTESVPQNGSATPPPTPVRAGWVFERWSQDFTNVTANVVTIAIYTQNTDRLSIRLYRDNAQIGSIPCVLSATQRDALDGERTLTFTTTAARGGVLQSGLTAELDGCFYTVERTTKNLVNGIAVYGATCEHLSYRLNDAQYDVEKFAYSGDTLAGLAQILSGTPLSAGVCDVAATVDIAVTQKTTRRALLMQYIALLSGEIEYDGRKINIKAHRGSTAPIELLEGKNVTDVGYSDDARAGTASYEIAFFKLMNLHVGDSVHIKFTPLAIDVTTRIVALEYNPFYRYNIHVEVGNYKPTINDALAKIENHVNAVTKDCTAMSEKVKEVAELSFGDMMQFTVTYTGGARAVYSYSIDALGRISSIRKQG